MLSENDPYYGNGDGFELQYSASRVAANKAIPTCLRPRPYNFTPEELELFGDINEWTPQEAVEETDDDPVAESNNWDALLEI